MDWMNLVIARKTRAMRNSYEGKDSTGLQDPWEHGDSKHATTQVHEKQRENIKR